MPHERLALALQAGQAGVGDAADRDVAQRADRQRADDRLGAQLLAGGERHATTWEGTSEIQRLIIARSLERRGVAQVLR